MRNRSFAAVGVMALGLALLAPSTAAQAAVKHYGSCAAVHRDYSGGIAKPGVNTNRLTERGKVVTSRSAER